MSFRVSFCSCVFRSFWCCGCLAWGGEGGGGPGANLSAFRTFVRFVLVWICRFPLPLGVWEGLRFGRIPNIWLAKKNVLFSLLMYIIITIYGRVKKSVMPLFIFWIIFLLDLELNFIGKLFVFRWELIVLLLLHTCFFFVLREIS